MNKKILSLLICIISLISLVACTNRKSDDMKTNNNETIINDNTPLEQTGFTTAVPNSYLGAANNKGTVERFDYNSKDYAKDESDIIKTAYVYLPYGYNENDTNTRYDIFYLMHGWTGYAGEYFEYGNVKNIIDNLIENGNIRPMIFVSATFYNSNSSNDFSSSVRELRAFHLDFENHLMPSVEGKYHTYAKSNSKDDLKASRDHRGFGGFSLGSVTTWLQFCDNSDYIRYFLPMSGSSWYYGGYGDFRFKDNVDYLEEVIDEHKLLDKGFFIYHAVGTSDAVKYQSTGFADELLKRNVFDNNHYVFYQKEDGEHDYYSVREFIYNALLIMFPLKKSAQYTLDTKIEDVIKDDIFADYGRLIFPVNKGYYSGTTLKDLRLTWYNYIDPYKTLEICNYFKENVIAGNQIFYDIYSKEEKEVDPSKIDTGLFFFKGNKNAKFAICNAGGGFAYVGAMHDSFPHALELSKRGYNAFALIYRPGFDTAMEDLARAIAFIFEHKEELEIDVNDYSLWGGSAGARMAATLGSYSTSYFGEKEYPRPAAVIMQYTGYSTVVGNEPPTYNCVGTFDGIASYKTMQNRISKIKANGTDAMIEIFDNLPHGFGLGNGTVADGWIDNAINFWQPRTKEEALKLIKNASFSSGSHRGPFGH